MSYPQIPQIHTDVSEQNNGSRFFQITKDTSFPHLWKSVKSVDENSLSPLYSPHSRRFAGKTSSLRPLPSVLRPLSPVQFC